MGKIKVALIDADSLMYYEMNAPTLEEAQEGIDNRIHSIMSLTKCDAYAGFLTIGRCFRYGLAKTKAYKYNRKGNKKPPIFYALKEYVQQTHGFVAIPGLEADDCVSIYSKYVKDELGKSVICSPDKDVLKQIPGIHFNYAKLEWVDTSEKDAEKFLWTQSLMGDPGDGIIGVHGVGPKTAEQLLTDNSMSYQQIVIKKYIEKFGNKEGVCRFAETFNLVYLLRTEEEALSYAGTTLPNLIELLTSCHIDDF